MLRRQFLMLVSMLWVTQVFGVAVTWEKTQRLGPSTVTVAVDAPYKNLHIASTWVFDAKQLATAVDHLLHHMPRTGLYLHQRPDQGLPVAVLKQLGFKFAEYDLQADEILWLLDNGREISQIGTSVTGAAVIVRNPEGKILVILNPDIDTWVFPSGGTDRGELIRETAVRELQEEVGLQAKPEDLQLLLITNSTHALKRPGLNLLNWFYMLEKYQGEPQTSFEAPELHWVDPKELLGKESFKQKKLHPWTQVILPLIIDSKGPSPLQAVKRQQVDFYLPH